ncbi:MAG: TlpA family protein disulfide reductase [Chloroflexi bacterium]|nr:TlpA family protein disulfide reductase [Chloroflexota bacterium]
MTGWWQTPRWTIVMVLAVVLAGGWTWISRVPTLAAGATSLPATPRAGFPAPDFTLDLLGDGGAATGQAITLSHLRGQVVIVNLWASWCPPCRAEMPVLEKIYRSNKARGLEILAVNATNQDKEQTAAAFARSIGMTFPVLLDRTGEVSSRYLLRALPSTFFVDRRGIIREVVFGGPMNEALIQSKLETLLNEAP